MERAWRTVTALGGLWVAVCLSGCGLLIGIEPIEVTGGTGGAGTTGDGSGASGKSGAGGSSGASQGCSAAGMACAQCAACVDIVDVDFDSYKTLPSFHGTTSGASRSNVGLVTGCTQAGGPERIYAVHPKLDGFLTASLTRPTTRFDSVLYARKGSDCCTTAATTLCADSSNGSAGGLLGGEVISFRAARGDDWFIFVDGVDDTAHSAGDYELVLSYAVGVRCDDDAIHVPIEVGSKMTLLGDAQGLGNAGEHCGQCSSSPCAGEGSEAIYQITAPPPVRTLQFALDPTTTLFDSVLYARSACMATGTQILCQDIQGAASYSGEKLKLDNTGAPLYVFVDTRPLQAQSYAYKLVVTPGM